ncbi:MULTISPECIES: glycosyltransferase [Salinibaculum]|uniref:glycosyltransferase n=1 Tax=Salinibaculum TaxID=2732368 RepID=UPI0030D30957
MTDDKTSVWYLIAALPVGGTERTLVDLATSLNRDRFNPTVFTVFDRNPLASELDGVSHRSLGVRSSADDKQSYHYRAADQTQYLRAPVRFLSAVRREQPDVLQSFLFFDNVIARMAGLVSPATTVITGVRSVPTDPHPLKTVADMATIRASDVIVSNSEAGAEFAIDRGAPAERVTVIRNGRRLGKYRDATPVGLRDDIDVPENSPVVGSVGRFIERKGHQDLIAAWPQIRSANPDSHMVLVGDGPRRDALCRQARALGCSGSIHFTGVRDDIPQLLALMDVFVFPSYFEGLPGALQEAMAAGLPIVATAVNGNDELITNEETGLLIPAEAPNAIGDAVNKLLGDRTLADELGQSASREATEQYSLSSMVSDFESVYTSEGGDSTEKSERVPNQ